MLQLSHYRLTIHDLHVCISQGLLINLKAMKGLTIHRKIQNISVEVWR